MKAAEIPDFNDTKNSFAYKENNELKGAYYLFSLMKSPILVRLGTWLTPLALKWGLPIKNLIRKTLFKQFVGGESLEKTVPTAEKLGAFGVQVILDYAVEGGEHDDAKYDEEALQFKKVIQHATTLTNVPFISLKITGLASTLLLEKIDNLLSSQGIDGSHSHEMISGLDEQTMKAWKSLVYRLESICETASNAGIGIMIDAEESWIQRPIDLLAMQMMERFNLEKAIVYNTVQLYRTDRLEFLKKSLAFTKSKSIFLGIKLVRGAYMEKERRRAEAFNYPSPIQKDKAATDQDFNNAIDFCYQHLDQVSVIVASHNEKSTTKAVDMASGMNLERHHPHIHFSQLFGMSDNLTFNLAAAHFNSSKYLPFGPVEEVVPYLMRRAQENTSVAGQTGRELELIRRELKRRGKQ